VKSTVRYWAELPFRVLRRFLAENSTFARRCAEEGIAFVGPNPETIKEMGDKTQVRVLAVRYVWHQP
jgi:biotin carboxylase